MTFIVIFSGIYTEINKSFFTIAVLFVYNSVISVCSVISYSSEVTSDGRVSV